MIDFISNISCSDKNVAKKYPDLIRCEAHFIIKIDEKVFFEEPNFPLYEFLFFVDNWLDKKTDDMNYVAIDTEDNPLISFINRDGKYKIKSPWQLFVCERLIDRKEIEDAILKLKSKN